MGEVLKIAIAPFFQGLFFVLAFVLGLILLFFASRSVFYNKNSHYLEVALFIIGCFAFICGSFTLFINPWVNILMQILGIINFVVFLVNHYLSKLTTIKVYQYGALILCYIPLCVMARSIPMMVKLLLEGDFS